MPLRCPRCSTLVPDAPQPACPNCGFAAPPPYATVPTSFAGPAWAPQKKAPDQAIAIVALLLNILVLAGLGSLIGGRTNEGIWQLVLYVGGLVSVIVFTITIIGILLLPLSFIAMLAGWIWGIVTGVQLLQASSQATPTHHNG